MSAFLIGYAIKADTVTQTRKLVLMKLVDAADEDGSNVYPGVRTIARAALCSERQVQRVLGEFCGVGLLEKVRDGVGGRGKGRPTEYRIAVGRLRLLAESGWEALEGSGSQAVAIVDGPARMGQEARSGGEAEATGNVEKGDIMSPIYAFEMGDMGAQKRVTLEAEKGDTRCHPTPPIDPFLDPYREREGAQARATDRDREGPRGGGAGTADREAKNRQEARSGSEADATGKQKPPRGAEGPSGHGREANKPDDGGGDPSRSRSDDRSSPLSSKGQSILDMIALYPGGRQDPRGRVEAAWERLTTDERQRAIDELPGWLEERKAARLRRMFLQTYLGERQFDLPKNGTAKSGGNARAGKAGKGRNGVTFIGENLSFRHWSAAWFAHLIWRVTNGKSIGLALQQARANPASGWGCPRAELPDLRVLDHVVHVSSRSDEWRAWRKWFEDRDPTAHWPSFDREMWFDLPSLWPPGLEDGRPEGHGALSENPDELPVEMRI